MKIPRRKRNTTKLWMKMVTLFYDYLHLGVCVRVFSVTGIRLEANVDHYGDMNGGRASHPWAADPIRYHKIARRTHHGLPETWRYAQSGAWQHVSKFSLGAKHLAVTLTLGHGNITVYPASCLSYSNVTLSLGEAKRKEWPCGNKPWWKGFTTRKSERSPSYWP